MATTVTFNGVLYSVPAYQDTGWAQGTGNLSSYLIAVATGCLQQTGGNFTLTADVNFGASFGLLSAYYSSRVANPATTGLLRLAKTDTIDWRNNANGANLALAINGSDQLTFNGAVVSTAGTTALTNAHIFVGNASNIATDVAVSGDVTLANTGAVTLNTVNGNVGSFTNSSITVNAKGLITAASNGTTAVTSVSGTANQITSTGGTTPVLAIANPLTLPGAMTAGGAIAMASNKITGLANATASGDALSYKSGVVIQSITTTHSADVSSTSATFADTGLSATITLTNASNKVRIRAFHQHANSAIAVAGNNEDIGIRIVRDSTVVKTYGDIWGCGTSAGSGTTGIAARGTSVAVYEDSPGDTSAHTYKTQFNNVNAQGTVLIYEATGGAGVMILEEIAV